MIGGSGQSFSYDFSGQRYKTVDSTAGTNVYTYYITPLMELRNHSTSSAGTLVYNIFAGSQRVATLSDGLYSYVLQDHLGGTALITDESGTVTEVYDYYPYGAELIADQLGTTETAHTFTDKEFSEELGLYYFEARWYNPSIGRFASLDPAQWIGLFLTDPQQLNFYNYSAGNPIKNTDPSGKAVYAVAKGLEANSYGTHVFLLIVPDNGNGEAWTLGGYAGDGGNLIKGQNAQSDVIVVQTGESMKDMVEVSAPNGMSDADFINSLTGTFEEYENDAAYDPFSMDGYNSNNFATDLLTESGVTNLPWDGNAPGIDPGYGESIPSDYTKPDGTSNIPIGSSQTSSAVSSYGSNESSTSSANWLKNISGSLSSK